jgi:CBS domain-containing protein
MIVNVFLVLFNLLPAFPMDGGRALRAVLSAKLGLVQATQIASSVGRAMAIGFALLGMLTNPFLVLIALFVWMGATQENAMAQAEALLGRATVNRAAIRNVHAVHEDDSLGNVVQMGRLTPQSDFPVLDSSGRLSGMLAQGALVRGLRERGMGGRVADVMNRRFAAIGLNDALEEALRKFQECQCGALPVMSDGQLAGLLTRGKLQEFLEIQRALAVGKSDAQPPVARQPSEV